MAARSSCPRCEFLDLKELCDAVLTDDSNMIFKLLQSVSSTPL